MVLTNVAAITDVYYSSAKIKSLIYCKRHCIYLPTFCLVCVLIYLNFRKTSVVVIPVHESSELKVFKTIKFLGNMFNNWKKDSLGLNVYKALEFYG